MTMPDPLDLAQIKDKLRRVDVLSGLPGLLPRADYQAVCQDIVINDVADLVAEVERLEKSISTIRWQVDSYLARARAELPQGEPLWLIETALGHIRDTAQSSGPPVK